MERQLLGRGVLNWKRDERVTDRYGAVHLSPVGTGDPSMLTQVTGHGRLVAVVEETRESTHIGDFLRGLFPVTPEVGEEIVLGVGTIFYEDKEVGLRPDDPRDSDWLNPEMLYRAHYQTVSLYFESDDI